MIFRVPGLGEGAQEGELVAWRVNVGDEVRPGQVLMEVLTDKATMEVASSFAGRVTALTLAPGQKFAIGEGALAYEPLGDEAPRRPLASPAVRAAARELGADLGRVVGTGPEGRTLMRDLVPAKERPNWGRAGSVVPFVGARRQIAERLAQSAREAPQATYVEEIEVTALVRLREELKEGLAQGGVKLTYLPFFVRAAALALAEVPIVNSSLEEGAIRLHEGRHVGVAVDAPGGLVVPVVRDADRRDVVEIARELARLANEARRGTLARDDLLGGTFTVSSVGNLGGLFTVPIVNPPQVAILGLGRVVRRPAFDERGAVRAADLVCASVSFDHRVLDGAPVAAFVNELARRLQAPTALMKEWR